jgi:protein-tyrosine kinase
MSRIHEALAKATRDRAEQMQAHFDIPSIVLANDVDADPALAAEALEPHVPIIDDAGHVPSPPNFQRDEPRFVRRNWRIEPGWNLFAKESKDKIGAERFRTLRSRLYQLAEHRQLKRVTVTSSLPSEGKSFVCLNLAQAIVHHQDRRVLLIDGDLRNPSLHKMFAAPRTPGLTNYLRGEISEHAAIQLGVQSNLHFLSAGEEATNPSELLLSERMKTLMQFAAQAFDWVIVDSPPALAAHDASLLADFCDGVLFVLRAGSTDFEIADHAAAEFRQKNLLGVVFNHVEKAESYYYYSE